MPQPAEHKEHELDWPLTPKRSQTQPHGKHVQKLWPRFTRWSCEFHIEQLLRCMTALVMELINTVFERVVDILKPRVHPYARLIKDLMAATVLITSIVAVVVGIIIFYPYIINKFF